MANESGDSADDLILKMQHLEAAARAQRAAHGQDGRNARLKTTAQKMAAAAQTEVEAAERDQRDAETRLARAHEAGRAPLDAAELLSSGKQLAAEARTRLVKARARLNFALDQMDEADRRDYQTLQLEAAAEAHAQLAESGDDSSRLPNLPSPASTPHPEPAAPAAEPGAGSGGTGAGGA